MARPNIDSVQFAHYQPIVERIARGISWDGRRGEFEDLVQIGLLALTELLRRDPEAHEGTAVVRCRGAMLDHVRTQAVTKRRAQDRSRKLAAARKRLRNEGTEAPTDGELATEAGMSLSDVERARLETRARHVPATEWGIASNAPDPSVLAQRRAAMSRIANALSRLEARQQEIVRSRYFDETPMREIAQNLGVSASRVSQLFGEALTHLEDELHDVAWPSTVPPAGYRPPNSAS